MFRIEYTSYCTNTFSIDNINLNEGAFNSVEKLQLEEVQIAPNPTNGNFTVTGDFDRLNMLLLDVNGRVVLSRQNVESGDNTDISNLPPGVYLVKPENENSICTKKLMH